MWWWWLMYAVFKEAGFGQIQAGSTFTKKYGHKPSKVLGNFTNKIAVTG